MRKIVSQKTGNIIKFVSLKKPRVKFLETELVLDKEITLPAGLADPRFVPEVEWIYLATIGGREYYSIHEDYTDEILSELDNDYKVETELDGNFTYTVFEENGSVKYKYDYDRQAFLEIGIPEIEEEPETPYVNLEFEYQLDLLKQLEESENTD